MNKKKLSRSGSLQSSVTSVLAALLCILIGLLVGFLVLVAINPAHAWGDGFVRIIKGGFHDAPYGVGKELANAAPLIMTGLSVAFAFKTGLFNIGAAGQYTLGAYGALYCAIMLKLPWFVCLLVAAVLGGLWGAIPGFFKAYFNINEVITSIMFNWIGLYLVNELIYQNGTGPMYDVRNTRTLNLSKNADFAQSLIPDFGLNKLFQTNSTTIAIFLAAAVAVLIWVVLNSQRRHGHQQNAKGKHLLAPDQIAKVGHDNAAQRTRQISGGKNAEGLHLTQPFRDIRREEEFSHHGGKENKDDEVVKLQRAA